MDLGERQKKILQAVVWSYVETAEPVGSNDLATRYAVWGVKSATIRNEMADLADQGYLKQPHTSSGRIPSDRGYRFYVDHLLVERPVDKAAADKTRSDMDEDRNVTLDRILRQTCALLAQMTRYTAVATPPRPSDTQLRTIFAAPASADTLLVVVLLSTSETVSRFITNDVVRGAIAQPAALVEAANALNAQFGGSTLAEVAMLTDDSMAAPSEIGATQTRSVFKLLAECLRQVARSASSEERVVVEGTGEILRQPEFQDFNRLERVIQSLQNRERLFDSASALLDSALSVVIGSENNTTALQDCSVITAPYYVGSRERGMLGVLGPTRMDYDRTLPAVTFMAKSLSDLLSRLA